MKILELFSGTESFSKVARAREHECFTVDNNPIFKPSLCKDIMDLKVEDIPFKPDIIWASPPCTTFSVASISRHWNKDGTPKESALKGMAIVLKTIAFIREMNPKFWIIENPRGMLRKQSFMPNEFRKTVTYCQYGHVSQKPTDLWNNISDWIPKPMCKPGSPCHEKASRGAKTGIQGIYNKKDYMSCHRSAVARAIIPSDLCQEILDACEIARLAKEKKT